MNKENLRQATADDIQRDRVVYIDGDDGIVEKIIDEVLNPSSMYKAFCADDGCRYGLDGCFIAIKLDGLCFANKGDSEANMLADMIVDHAMKTIDAEDGDHADVRGVVERMIAAGYSLTETCDPVGYND